MNVDCKLEQVRDQTWYQSSSLAVAVTLAAGLLLLLDWFTGPIIEQQLAKDKMDALSLVMPENRYHNALLSTEQYFELEGTPYWFYHARDEHGEATGYVVQSETQGYAGPISFLVGTDQRGEIIAVEVLSHTETPGLGDKIESAKSDWNASFQGLSLNNTGQKAWAVTKDGGDFDQFTGATITPRAVVNGVHHSLQTLQQQLEKELSHD